jgi:hypothetical protein
VEAAPTNEDSGPEIAVPQPEGPRKQQRRSPKTP